MTRVPQQRSAKSAQDAAQAQLNAWLTHYRPLDGAPDELIGADGAPRPAWRTLLSAMAALGPEAMTQSFAAADRHIREAGVSHRVYGEDHERLWPLSHMPVLISARDWAEISAGIVQRATLFEHLLKDIYGPADFVRQGWAPAAAITGSRDFLRPMIGVDPPGGRHLHLYAADLGRGPDGRWWVLGDRTQAPSGAGYALENRLVLSRAFPDLYTQMNVERLAPFFSAFRAGLAASAARADPRICLMTPGPYSETYFEQAHLARYLGFLLVEGEDLVVVDGHVHVRTIAGLKRADVLWRRVDGDFIDPLELNSASQLGVPSLLDAMRRGGVVVANAPGSGVVESRALLGFLPALAQRLFGADLILPNVATWWCGQARERDYVLDNFDALTIADAFGPQALPGQLISKLDPLARGALIDALRERPIDYVGQDVARLSTTPVYENGRLSPRPFVLRVYAAATPDGWAVMPGGFCRISDKADARAISMGGGVRSTDVWVLSDAPVERVSLITGDSDVRVRRLTGHLPSRAADNLYWLGRYLERLEATLRLVRSLGASLMEADGAGHSAGVTLNHLANLLIAWGGAPRELSGAPAAAVAGRVINDRAAPGAAIPLMQAITRTASKARERFSADAWRLFDDLHDLLVDAPEAARSIDILERSERAIVALAALSGMAQENMNRLAGWRFLDLGRRIERAIAACRFTRALAGDDSSLDDLDALLDLVDSQITYRSRYLSGLARTPLRDMVLLDPHNPRSAAFQMGIMRDHLDALPKLESDGVPEEPHRLILQLEAAVGAHNAHALTGADILALEQILMRLSDAISARYFLQGAHARRVQKLSGLA